MPIFNMFTSGVITLINKLVPLFHRSVVVWSGARGVFTVSEFTVFAFTTIGAINSNHN
jgi:hypothetical protein